MRKKCAYTATFGALFLIGLTAPAPLSAASGVPVGQLVAETGSTAQVASAYGKGVADALAYINRQGGINGKPIALDTVDYGYDLDRALGAYKTWKENLKPVAIQGWGTADTEALVDSVSKDAIVFMSGSSSGHLTDPTGRSPWTSTPAPYNFFYGPSYSDGCRGLVQWAAEDWRRSASVRRSTFLGDLDRPKFVFMGDNHPYPNSPKAACTDYARSLGFEVLQPIRYSLSPADFAAQCQSLKSSGAHYAFLANTAESNIKIVKDCAAAGVSTQFLTNIYGWDEGAAKEAGAAGNGMVWVVSVAQWGDDAPGMKTVREVSKVSDPTGAASRPAHYIRGVCSAYLMRDAMMAADKSGDLTGPGIKKALEDLRDHVPAGLEGVCLPTTFTAVDHRGATTVNLYRNDFSFAGPHAQKIYTTTLPLRPDWLGW
jgi:branched-chain amino acid transport system substrate-binding protein